MTCPECGCDQINTRLRVEYFEWHAERIPRQPVTIRVVVPVRECLFCGAEWQDGAADIARGQALQRHYSKEEPRF